MTQHTLHDEVSPAWKKSAVDSFRVQSASTRGRCCCLKLPDIDTLVPYLLVVFSARFDPYLLQKPMHHGIEYRKGYRRAPRAY